MKSCSFFGHRNVEMTEELKDKVKSIVEDLIINHNVYTFLFGSRSNFDTLCHLVVTELKEKYRDIKRIAYTCKSESCVFENEKKKWEETYSRLYKKEVHLCGVEEEREYKSKDVAGRASYIERNYAMINDSDYCVFYFDENYMPDMRKYSKRNALYYQPKSGTFLAYNFAKQKKKSIINILDSWNNSYESITNIMCMIAYK